MEWIDELDRDLSCLREREARLYYDADAGNDLDVAELKAIADRRRTLITPPEIMSKSASLMEGRTDPLLRRRAELLRLQTVLTRIEDDPELLALRHELEQAQQGFGDEMKTPEGIRSYLSATERSSRARIRTANGLARQEVCSDYPAAKLACQELPMPNFLETLTLARRAYEPDCTEVLSQCDAERLSSTELDRAVAQMPSCEDDAFPAKKGVAAVRRTLSAFGVKFDDLPITIEFANLPYSGAVRALKIGGDVRVVMNKAKAGFHRYAVLFHELGHALYYAYVPDSVLLLDSRIGREGLAELWTGFIEREQWLRQFSSLRDPEISDMMLTLVRESLFELALYQDPEADFLEVWCAVTDECLGIRNRSDLYSEFVFLYPLDIKDYIYAHLIRENILVDLQRRFGTDLLAPDVFDFVVKNYYEMGNRYPWHRRFPGFNYV